MANASCTHLIYGYTHCFPVLMNCHKQYDSSILLFILPRAKKPAGLEGKNWRDFRKKQRRGHNHWQPMKRLTHEQMDHLRNLKQMQPEEWTNQKLATKFGISLQSVIRILKSKFDASPEIRARQDTKALQQRDKRREKMHQELKRKQDSSELSKQIILRTNQ